MELVVPAPQHEVVFPLLDDLPTLGVWSHPLAGDLQLALVLIETDQTEPLMDRLESLFSHVEGFRLMLLPVEAELPRLDHPAENGTTSEAAKQEPEETPCVGRISREELYAQLSRATDVTRIFFVLVVLASLVAAIGIFQANVTVVIGAMVIAPLLGPNIALALATTLGDGRLTRSALRANAVGVLTAAIFSVALGLVVHVDPAAGEIASRTSVEVSVVALALASGSAGVLAFPTGVPSSLIGVMVAVALLPPLVTAGLLTGAGRFALAGGALLLFLVNVSCVNLSGIVTLLAQGVRPRLWHEAERARRVTWYAITGWGLLLVVVLALILFEQRR